MESKLHVNCNCLGESQKFAIVPHSPQFLSYNSVTILKTIEALKQYLFVWVHLFVFSYWYWKLNWEIYRRYLLIHLEIAIINSLLINKLIYVNINHIFVSTVIFSEAPSWVCVRVFVSVISRNKNSNCTWLHIREFITSGCLE